ncbi:MAG: hypothetical protein AAF483_31275 [Planctomycetota bacterium]
MAENRFGGFIIAIAFLPLLGFTAGCIGSGSAFEPVAFAEKSLAESYAVKAELGEVKSVKLLKTEGSVYSFAVEGSIQNATLALLANKPAFETTGTLYLEDGRQIPLFIPFLEESYKEDLGL